MSPTILISAMMMGAVLAVSCQAPSEPAAIKSADSGSSNKPAASPSPAPSGNPMGASLPAASASLTSCGSQVGTPDMNVPVLKCRDSGMFYDRQSSDPDPNKRCTTMPIAKISCSIDNVKSVMAPADAQTLTAFMADANSLKDFIVDQILDCSAPASASFAGCQMQNVPPGAKVVKLYMAKQVSGQINIKTLLVALPAAK